MLAIAKKDLSPRSADALESRPDPLDPESNLGEPLARCCFCDKSLAVERLELKGMTAREAQMVLKADLDTVNGFLAKFQKILALCGEHCCFPFASLTYQEENEDHSSTFLYDLMKKAMLDSGSDEEDYAVALDTVLDKLETWFAGGGKNKRKIKQFLRRKDGASGRTVIHLAASKWGSRVVKRLLNLGANIGEIDHFGEVAVTSISPDLLETFLDTKWSPGDGDPDVEDYKIKFNFQFLQCDQEDMVPAMQTLMAMSDSKQHRKLLVHPVLTTFLALQWKEFSVFYNLNTFFTFLYCTFVNLFILRNYGGSSLSPLSLYSDWASCNVDNFPGALSGTDSCLLAFWWITLLFSLTMVAREMAQAVGHITSYFCSLENWTEITFLTSTFVLLAFSSRTGQPVCHMRALAATILLLSWVIFFGMVGRHPNIQHHNVYITMFFKVMKRFVKIFLAFMPYIIALGLFFYISLHQDGLENPGREATFIAETDESSTKQLLVTFDEVQQKHKKEILEKIDEKGDFMNRVGFSVLKSMAMFVGELEFSDIRFENMPYFSHMSFFFFVILFVVVLMNYLTGIAVGCGKP